MDLTEKKIASERIYDGRVLHVYRDTVRLPNGNETTRELIRHQGAVAVVPLLPNGDVVMVRQYRYPFSRVMLEIPAGKIDPGEKIENSAVRELSEETGATAGTWTDLGTFYPSVAYTDEVIYLYLAKDLTFGDMHTDEDEFLNVERVPLRSLVDRVLSGEIADGKTQAAILKTWMLENR